MKHCRAEGVRRYSRSSCAHSLEAASRPPAAHPLPAGPGPPPKSTIRPREAGSLGREGQRTGASSCPTPPPRPFLLPGPLTARVAPRTKESYPPFYRSGSRPRQGRERVMLSGDLVSDSQSRKRPAWCRGTSLPWPWALMLIQANERKGPTPPRQSREPFLKKPEKRPGYLLTAPHGRCKRARESREPGACPASWLCDLEHTAGLSAPVLCLTQRAHVITLSCHGCLLWPSWFC